ncbi:MAG TPA: TetR family transcriptional regulator [Acidimicrobiales bacterium]|nr:TetR family transcriptional regulator [Acidimicrobiales bacterium]
MTPPLTDKGRARRSAIASAAAALLLDGGPPAVTHRAVAQRAGVSLGSTTYYFADRDELLAAAIERARSADVTRARTAASQSPGRGRRGLAGRLVDVVVGLDRLDDPDRVAAHYQRFLGAARTEPGRAGVSRWNRELRDTVADTLVRHHAPEKAAGAVLALVDGCVLAWLIDEGTDPDADALVDRVRDGLTTFGVR